MKNTATRLAALLTLFALASCTQEQQNKISRDIQNYTSTNGVLDENLNMIADPGEKKVYFEISDYASNYVFFESPR